MWSRVDERRYECPGNVAQRARTLGRQARLLRRIGLECRVKVNERAPLVFERPKGGAACDENVTGRDVAVQQAAVEEVCNGDGGDADGSPQRRLPVAGFIRLTHVHHQRQVLDSCCIRQRCRSRRDRRKIRRDVVGGRRRYARPMMRVGCDLSSCATPWPWTLSPAGRRRSTATVEAVPLRRA